MASSQVEVAASNPFGCVLRDHNSRNRDRRRDPNGNPNPSPKTAANSFQRNFKDLVRDHLQSCISLSPRASSTHETDENSEQQCGGFRCFGGGANASSSKTATITATSNQKNTSVVDQKGNQAPEKAQVEAQNQNQTSFITGSAKKERRDPSPTRSESSCSDFSVSSLVQKWRGFEANNHSAGPTTPAAMDTSACSSVEGGELMMMSRANSGGEMMMSRANSGVSTSESTLTNADEREEMSYVEEREIIRAIIEEEMEEKEREKERERIRVADIVRKWPGDESAGVVCLARLKLRRENNNKGKNEGEGKTFSPPRLAVSSPRIRGRQAIADLFMRMERERYEEVEVLGSNHPVTKFPHRGRIQALLRLRFLRRDQTIEEQQRRQRPPLPSKVVRSSRCHTGSSITSLREKFNSSVDQDSIHQRAISKETPNSSHHNTQIASTSKHTSEKPSPEYEPNAQKFLAKREQETETENTCTISKQSIDDQTIQISDKKSVSDISPESPKQNKTGEELTIPSHSDENEYAATSNENSKPQLDNHCEESKSVSEVCVREEEAQQNRALEVPNNDVPSYEALVQENGGNEEDAYVNMETQDVDEAEASYNGYWGQEEAEDYYYKDPEASQYYFEPNLDWITDIARPRSYWEDLRQAWYREVFNTRSQNEEIRQLLERGSVSNVLASDFRERMDQLITNTVQRATHSSLEEHEDDRSMRAFIQEHVEDARQENRRQLLERGCVSAVLASDFGDRISHLLVNRVEREMPLSVVEEQNEDKLTAPEQIEDNGEEQNEDKLTAPEQIEDNGEEQNEEEDGQEGIEEEDENENGEIVDEIEDHESSSMHQYQNINDLYEQNSTRSSLHWDQHDDESNYYSDNAESTSIQEPSPLTSYDRGSSSFKNPSIEMELIYDLRSHMEQLYREMAELRKSVTSCMDMQINMQQLIREEVATAIMRKDSASKITKQVEKKDSNRRKPKKGTCCICHEKKIDSLLYRCGHMCTCFACANELQWGSGKCPICRAQIIDVVRAYPDS